jgi:5'-deoxynucleotidase YfbR-like HD superfamily hydrolase
MTNEQAYKCMAMATFHDVAEGRTGDHDFFAKNYNVCDEDKAIKDQCAGLPFESDLHDLLTEYEERQTIESKIVKDADSLAQTFHERVLMRQGNKMAEQWFE